MKNFNLLNHNLAIDADIWSLERMINEELSFNIPIYQRLYVWEASQIKTLLEDLSKAAEQPDRDYFLGGIMLSSYKRESDDRYSGNRYDLIDGQQRMLTLWLIARVLQGDLEPFMQIKCHQATSSRITFSIRDQVNAYFNQRVDEIPANFDPELEPVINALDIIKGWLGDEAQADKCELLTHFIATRLKLSITIMPDFVKGNELFEAINNRGKQLQHHQILKSLLLEELPVAERNGYHLIWEACADMDGYIEENIKLNSGLSWKDLISHGDDPGVKETIWDLLTKQDDDEAGSIYLLDLLRQPDAIINPEKFRSEDDYEYDACPVESIISFPMLLLHVLRIWLRRVTIELPAEAIPPVHEKQLLALFDQYFFTTSETNRSIDFLHLLWQVRVKFDRYIIKWLDNHINKPYHAISCLYKSEDRLARREDKKSSGFALLQSMLYHSQESITQYWLTPFLARLLEPGSVEDHYSYLRQLDNQLFCTGPPKVNLSTRTWHITNNKLEATVFCLAPLSVSSGTSFSRYWFYKLDFILWYYSSAILLEFDLNNLAKKQWEEFRMTSRSSVEHVSPQHPEDGDVDLVYDKLNDGETTIKKHLDDFGNLVLVTTSVNSSYGRKPYKVKRELFASKNRMESLKSCLLFQNQDWNHAASSKHRSEMIAHFRTYFLENQMIEGTQAKINDSAACNDA